MGVTSPSIAIVRVGRSGSLVRIAIASSYQPTGRSCVFSSSVYSPTSPGGRLLTAGPATVGTLASVAGHDGLALLRLDRVIEQMDAGNPVLAAGTPLEVGPDELAAFRRMSEARKPDTAS